MHFSHLSLSSRALTLALAMASVAIATADSKAETTPPASQKNPATTEELHDQSPAPSENKPAADLSKELQESEGIITPPRGVDPEIKKSTPKDFSSEMPVLPPPGEPGGDQSVQPK